MAEVKVEWKGEMEFEGKDEKGNTVRMVSGSGPTPMSLLLMAFGGCTGLDVVSILEKMRVRLDDLEIDVKGERSEEHPKTYESIELVYRIRGDVDEEKARRAIDLSMDKYCSVGAMLKNSADVTYRVEILR
jgi:putative redox protein